MTYAEWLPDWLWIWGKIGYAYATNDYHKLRWEYKNGMS